MVHMWFLFFSKSLDNIISINRTSLSYLKNFNIVIYIPTELESFFSLSWINSKHLYMICWDLCNSNGKTKRRHLHELYYSTCSRTSDEINGSVCRINRSSIVNE